MAYIADFQNLRLRPCPDMVGKAVDFPRLEFAPEIVRPLFEKKGGVSLMNCLNDRESVRGIALKYGFVELVYEVSSTFKPVVTATEADLAHLGFALTDEVRAADFGCFLDYLTMGLDEVLPDGPCFAHIILKAQHISRLGRYKVVDACVSNWRYVWNGRYLFL